MQPRETSIPPAKAPRSFRTYVLAALALWVVAWIAFVMLSHSGDRGALLAKAGTVVLPIVVGAVLAWRRPLLGGLVLTAFGAITAWLFEVAISRLALSLPAIAFGLYFAWRGVRRR